MVSPHLADSVDELTDEAYTSRLQHLDRAMALRAIAISEGMELWSLDRINREVTIRRGHIEEDEQ
jgi:hypothetical protein